MEEIKERLKQIFKRILKIKILIPVIALALVIMIIAGSAYVILRWVALEAPMTAAKYTNSVAVNEDGTISAGMSARQIWNEMVKAGYEIENYLNGPEDLERLLNAELVTQYPDTREDVTKEIDWEALRTQNREKASKTDSTRSDKELNVLFIGDSKTYTNNLPNMFEQLAHSLKKGKVHAYSTENDWGEADLDSFLDDEDKFKDFSARVKEKKWDYLVLQQQSEASLDEERTSKATKRIIDYVKENSNKKVEVIYDAWGPDMSYNTTTYGQAMQAFSKAKNDNGGSIAYIANQLVAFHDKYPQEQLDNGDGLQPNVAGSYLAACSTYKAIFGQKTQGATYNAGISKELAENIQKCIDESDGSNSLGDKIQGIIKFKRHDENGRTFYLTYAEPGEYQNKLESYNRSGTSEAKDFLLKHFTLKEKPRNTTDGTINGAGSFTKYNFSDDKIKQLANLCNQEQGTPKGAAAEASLMANLFELYGSSFGQGCDGLYNYVRNSGWFAHAASHMDGGSSDEETVQAVKAVLVQGYRTLPKYVDEHDCESDLSNHPASRSEYIQHQTVLNNVYGATYTFYSFPDTNSDPFGYKVKENREKYSDFCYEYGTWKPLNGKEDPNASDVHAASGGSLAGASDMGRGMVEFVKSKVGGPYVHGGRGPDGYDCSNLTSCAYELYGITISGNDQDQYEDPQFVHVPVEQAVPGDILWTQGHVGMYIGNNEFVHASGYDRGIVLDPYSYYNPWVVALHHPSNTSSNSTRSSTSSSSSSSSSASGSTSNSASPTGASEFGKKVVEFAKTKLGLPYVWGAEGPDAYDCSGLTQAAYKYAGASIPHQSGLQHDDPQFDQVPVEQAAPGDILWTPGHVGLYIGGNEYIHANGSIVAQDNLAEKNGWTVALHYKNYGSITNTTTTTVSANYTGQLDKSKSGDGYPGTYTSSTGFEYKDFKQGWGSYAEDPYWGGTISSSGCGPSSIAILASGLKPSLNKTPRDTCATVRDKYGNISSDEAMISLMNELGMTCEYESYESTPSGCVDATKLQEMLRQGKVMMLLGIKDVGSIFPNGSGHFYTAVDIDKDGKIFVMNPNGKGDADTGWYDAETVARGCTRVFATDSGKVADVQASSSSEDSATSDSDRQGYEAVVASWKEVRKATTYDNSPEGIATAKSLGLTIENGTVYSITTSNINYEELVKSYTLPFDLLWTYLVIGQSRGFIMDWADLAYNAEIEVSLFDNLKTTTEVDDWNYEIVRSGSVAGSVGYTDNANKIKEYRDVNHTHYREDEEELKVVKTGVCKTKVTTENKLTHALTKAHTWVADYDADYTYNKDEGAETKGSKKRDDETWLKWTIDSQGADTCGLINEKIDEVVEAVNKKYKKIASKVQSSVTSASDIKPIEKKEIEAKDVDTSHVLVRTKTDLVNIVDETSTKTTSNSYTKLTPKFKINDEKHPTATSSTGTSGGGSTGSTARVDTALNPTITEHHADLPSGSFDYYLYQARPEGTGQPLMLSLHGSGENGGGLGALHYGGSLARFILEGSKRPDCIVIMPSNGDPQGGWGAWNVEALKELVDKVASETKADTSHLSITGVSRGGYDTWEMLAKYPTMFEAAAPIASDGWQDGLRDCKSRILALSGSADSANFCDRGVDIVISGGGTARHQVIDGAGHSDMCNIYGNDAYDPVPFLLETANTPTTAAETPTVASNPISSLDNFLFIGDSRYDGVEEINNLGSNIKNLGVGSARIDEWVKVAQEGGVGVIQPTTKFRRDVDITGNYAGISIQLGANSLDRVNGADVAAGEMKELITALKKLHPNTPIFVNSCLPDSYFSIETITGFNNKVKEFCTGGNVYYIDISDGLVDSSGFIKQEYTFDGCHLGSSEAYRIFAENIKKGILNCQAGETADFDSPNNDIVAVAEKLWKEQVWHSGKAYAVGQNIPIEVNSICCSSWASWVLYEYGYKDFEGPQKYTVDFLTTNWNEKYGWYEIPLEGGQNPINELQPGDFLVRDPGDNNGHITFVAKIEGDRIYCYDCGNVANWESSSVNGEPIDKSYMLTDGRTGKVIRVGSTKKKKTKARENFVSLFIKNKYIDNKNNILSATDLLFEIIEKNEKISNLLDIMKYLLYKATGTDYGVKELNDEIISMFFPSNEELESVNGGTSGSGFVGSTIQEKTWWALRDAGFSEEAAAGAMGNVTGESNWDPGGLEIDIYNGHQYTFEEIMSRDDRGFGLVGWTVLEEKEPFVEFAKHRGKPWYDEDTQIEFMVAQLTKDPSDADGYAKYVPFDNPAWGCTVSGWENAATPEDAAYQFCWIYERPYKWDPRRQTWAREFYEQFKGKQRPVSNNTGIGSGSKYANASIEEKLAYVFPNGAPQSEAELMPYLTDIEVPITTKEGAKTTAFVQVHKAIAQDVYNACVAAQKEGFKIYEIGGYREFGTDSAGAAPGLSYSQHCYGLAIDVNVNENAMFDNGSPSVGNLYDPNNNEYSLKPNGAFVSTLKSAGWGWGADWPGSRQDYMHLSFMGW